MAKFLDSAGLERLTEHLNVKLSAKQDKLTGTQGQVVGFGEDGTPEAQDAPETSGGIGQSVAGQTVEPAQGETVTAGEGAEIFNDYRTRAFESDRVSQGNVASGIMAHAEGMGTTASGDYSHAEGCGAAASGYSSHAEGTYTTASGQYSHAEGAWTSASFNYCHAEGDNTVADGTSSHAEGSLTSALGPYSHAEGYETMADGEYSHVEGEYSVASGRSSHAGGDSTIAGGTAQTAIGAYNVESQSESDRLIVGKGYLNQNPYGEVRANCFRVTNTGVFATGAHNTTGADYAELFQWLDDNPDRQDRVGRFVTLDGDRIRLAGPEDSFILGVVSGNPSVVGDVHDDQWQGMYLYDVFGRPIWEDVEVPAKVETRPNPVRPGETITREITPAHMEHRQKLNPAYDRAQRYIPRSERPEWDAVGMLGKLVVVDDGTCRPNGWCAVGQGGAAVCSEQPTRFRVMARLDESHVRVLVL